MTLHKDTISLFNANPELALLLAPDAPIFTILAANNAYEKHIGIKAEKIVGKGLFEVFPDKSEKPSPLLKSLKAVVSSKSIDSINNSRYDLTHQKTEEKEAKHWKICNSPILADNGEIDYILHLVIDISKEVRESEIKDQTIDRKSNLLATAGLFASALLSNESWEDVLQNVFGLIGRTVDASRVYYFENSLNTLTGKQSTTQIMEWCSNGIEPQKDNPELQNASLEDFEEFFEPLINKKPFIKLTKNIHSDRLRLLLESMKIKSVLIMPIFINKYFHGFIGFDECKNDRIWNEEEIEFLKSIVSNLTIAIGDQQHFEAFKESQQRLQSAINNSPGVIYRCKADDDWTATFVSKEIERLTGYPSDDFIFNKTRSLASIIHPEDYISVSDLHTMLEEKSSYKYECRIICKDGTIKWIEDRGTGIYDEKGNLTWIDGVIIDTTDRIQTLEKYKAIVENTSDAIMLADEDGNYVAVNRAATEIFGYTESEFNHMNVENLLLPHPGISFEEIWEDFKSKKESSGNMDLLTKWNKTISVSYKAKTNLLPGLHLSVITNITETIQKEQELKASERRFKALVQEGSDLISIINSDGEFTFIGESTSKILNINNSDFIGTKIFNYIHKNDLGLVQQQFQKLFSQKQLKLSPYRLIDGNGKWRWTLTTATNLLDDPAVNGIVTNSRDITEIVEKELALKRANTQYELAQRATRDAIWDLDLATESITWGEGYKSIFGYHKNTYKYGDQYLNEKIHPDDIPRVVHSFNNAINDPTQDLWNEDYRYFKSDNTIAYITNRGFISRDNNGKAIRVVGSMQDITTAKNLEIQKELMHSLTVAFNTSVYLKESLDKALSKIADFFRVSLSEAWITSIDGTKFNLLSQIIADEKAEKFREKSSDFTSFPKGEGLIGKCWETGKIEKWNTNEGNPAFLRENAAKNSNLKNSYAVPIKYHNHVIAVFNFISDFKEVNLPYFEQILLGMSEQIGTEVLRKMREEELHNFFELSSDVLIIAGFDGLFKKINPALKKLLGFTEQELMSQPFIHFIHPDDVEDVSEVLLSVNKGSVVNDFETRLIKKNGAIVWVTWTATPKVEEGLLYAVGKDITERKSFDLEILQTNEQLKTAQDIAKIGYWSRNMSSDISQWSKEVYEIYEQDPETFVPSISNLKEVFYPEDHQYLEGDFTEFFPTEGYHDFEHRILANGNKEKWVFQRIKLLRDEKGNPIKIDGVIQDITILKTREIQLQISNERFEMAMKATNEMIWDWDIVNDTVTRSQGFETLFGFKYSAMNSVQSFWLENVYKDDIKSVKVSLFEALENKEIRHWHKEYRFVKANGEIAFISDRGHIIRNDKGVAIRMVGAVLDITESRKLLKEITLQNQALKEIAWTQSHVVRAPLSRLLGFISLIEQSLFDNEDEYFIIMNGIKTSAEELDLIVRDIVSKTGTMK